jgi:hypothetical protein
LESSITGTAAFRAGGGSGATYSAYSGIAGGQGGGGESGTDGIGYAGATNSGGGGGAGSLPLAASTYYFALGYAGGNGGSGIVIIRYPDSFPLAASTTGSPTVTTTGGYRIYQFNGSGSITW